MTRRHYPQNCDQTTTNIVAYPREIESPFPVKSPSATIPESPLEQTLVVHFIGEARFQLGLRNEVVPNPPLPFDMSSS
jgi:hypothetical protein